MDPEDAGPAPEARPPLLEDLVSLCRNLNREGARYVVIGGMARALMALPDQAIRDMAADDLEKYAVVLGCCGSPSTLSATGTRSTVRSWRSFSPREASRSTESDTTTPRGEVQRRVAATALLSPRAA